ncbi:hypothetical protein [Phenylobacterium immobile]|uniref:hypothetical protein n=1 Tax=Phenylobacterium immobile TaxID=21 RepID=UPI000AD00105|nr:hypothetical protein [Phenylobacterium immobile]
MDDQAPADETPMQRALRLKKAALDAKSAGRPTGKGPPKPTAGVAAGASRPWMKK